MKSRIKAAVLGFAFVGILSSTGKAETSSLWSVGLLGGVTSLNNGGGSSFGYGALADYMVHTNWSLGLQYNATSPSIATLGTSYTVTLSNIDLAIKYNCEMWKFGILVGTQLVSSNAPGATSTSNFNYGLVGSYDWMLGTNISIGPQIDAIWTSQSNGYTELDFLAAVKYQF